MVVDDFHVIRADASLRPLETDPPLVVDSDAPLPLTAPLQGFEPVARGAKGRECRSPRRAGPACARQSARSRRTLRPDRRGRRSPSSCRQSQRSPRFRFRCYDLFERRHHIRVTSSIMRWPPNRTRRRSGRLAGTPPTHGLSSAIRITGPPAVVALASGNPEPNVTRRNALGHAGKNSIRGTYHPILDGIYSHSRYVTAYISTLWEH